MKTFYYFLPFLKLGLQSAMLFFFANKFETELGKNYSFCDGRKKKEGIIPSGDMGFVLSDMMDETRGCVCPDMTDCVFICLSELTAVERLLSSMIPVGSTENGIIHVNPKQIMAFLISAEMN